MDIPQKETPLETVSVGTEVSKGVDGIQALPGRIQRYGAAKKRALQMHSYIDEISDIDPFAKRLAPIIRNCGEYLVFRNYFTVKKLRLHAAVFCRKHLLCPLCAIRRGAKTLKCYLDRYEYIQANTPLQGYHIVFTVKNGDDLLERYNHLQRCLKILQKRRHDHKRRGTGWTEFARMEGAVGSYEFTNKGNGWHPHLHLIALCSSPIDQFALSREWQSITGDSFIIHVEPFYSDQSPAWAFQEVFKYALKYSELSVPDNWIAFRKLNGRHLLLSFGNFRGVKIPKSMADEPLDDLPFVEYFFRYYDSRYRFLSDGKNEFMRRAV